MNDQEIHDKYVTLFDQLKEIIQQTQNRIICAEPDPFFENNVNFFVKSFLISICAYLESYLKEIAFIRIEVINTKLSRISIPRNLVQWDILRHKEIKDNDFKFEDLKITITKKDLDEHISGNPYRTITLFKKIGINLNAIDSFVYKKDIVNAIVVKRNNITHHNSQANDVSMADLIIYIDNIIDYMDSITQAIKIENTK
ncbi:HEPN domain-containing protein [Anabaena sp. WFMT]|uniref:HEPN domain-containing protein n=1 Tax=Anabaena sp. WFMT TaxID=3449730 RepID=UPI003F27208F